MRIAKSLTLRSCNDSNYSLKKDSIQTYGLLCKIAISVSRRRYSRLHKTGSTKCGDRSIIFDKNDEINLVLMLERVFI